MDLLHNKYMEEAKSSLRQARVAKARKTQLGWRERTYPTLKDDFKCVTFRYYELRMYILCTSTLLYYIRLFQNIYPGCDEHKQDLQTYS